MVSKSSLLLLPNLIGDHKYHEVFLPGSVDKAVAGLDGLIAESERAGRRYLSRFKTKKPPAEIPIALLNEHTASDEIDFLLEPLKTGERWGVISDAGLPCLADPGSVLVQRARQLGIQIQAFVGPSSIILGLMLSGMPSQKFSFLGYLDKTPDKRRIQIQALEKRSREEGATQMFIETPYRNKHLIAQLVETLGDDTHLCAAWDLTLPSQGVLSQPIQVWKKSPLPNLEKKNAIFLVSASNRFY